MNVTNWQASSAARDSASTDGAPSRLFLGCAAVAAAWALVAGIEVDKIDSFLADLTPVHLLEDTLVTNHGYRDAQAVARQSVLQASTVVLVDQLGMNRC